MGGNEPDLQPSSLAQDQRIAARKSRVALASVLATAVLVFLKLGAGLFSGSLGLIAEAAHSGTDLVAALLTLFAIRVALKPPDQDHQFGHGKAEHLAALAESTFLLGVSGWLAVSSVNRLIGEQTHEIKHTTVAIVVLLIVIVIDASRLLITSKASKELNSAALKSNALHFASDLAGSTAVLFGLFGVAMGFHQADSFAALLVAGLVLVASFKLMKESIDVLMDKADLQTLNDVSEILQRMPSQPSVKRLRARHAAGRHFIDVVLAVRSDVGIGFAHDQATLVESEIERQLPGSDVVVHVEPELSDRGLRESVTAAALTVGSIHEVHNVDLTELQNEKFAAGMHVKVNPEMSLRQAHEIADQVEEAVKDQVPQVLSVLTHIEPLSVPQAHLPINGELRKVVVAVVREAVDKMPQAQLNKVAVAQTEAGLQLAIDLAIVGEQSVYDAHRLAGAAAQTIRSDLHEISESNGINIDKVLVHTEPF